MKALLFYNDNIAPQLAIDFNSKLGVAYRFQIGKQELLSPSYTIDEKIDSILINELENCKYDCIFIPYSLSEENYLEFIGLRIAHHIRLTPEFNNIQTPIVFFGNESAFDINRLSEMGRILFSRGVFTTEKTSIFDFEKQMEFFTKHHEEIDAELFNKRILECVEIRPSGNYASHHSITNEWSIYRWAKALKIDDEHIRLIEKKIGCNLYFKYLKTRYSLKEPVETTAQSEIVHEPITSAKKEERKILFIDDEIEKGWNSIFEKICHRFDNAYDIKYIPFKRKYKDVPQNEIIKTVINEVLRVNPDTVVLDFRLHDIDFRENVKVKDITGFKILENIKTEINPGIQVIILSATNKIWNLLELQKAGADDFIMKEAPELTEDVNFSTTSINNVYDKLNDSLIRAKFLKMFVDDKNKIIDLINSETYSKDFKVNVENNLAVTFKLLYESFKDEKYKNYAYLQLFQIIEEWLKQDCVFEVVDDKCYVINGNKKYLVKEKADKDKYHFALKYKPNFHAYVKEQCSKDCQKSSEDTYFKMSAVLLFNFSFERSDALNWNSVNEKRNKKAAHFDKGSLITIKEIEKIIQFILYIFDSANFKEPDPDFALHDKTEEEKRKELKNKFSQNNL